MAHPGQPLRRHHRHPTTPRSPPSGPRASQTSHVDLDAWSAAGRSAPPGGRPRRGRRAEAFFTRLTGWRGPGAVLAPATAGQAGGTGETNRQITLVQRPDGLVRRTTSPSSRRPCPNRPRVRPRCAPSTSLDPTVRTWISPARSYSPVAIGEVVRCPAPAGVVASTIDILAVGDPIYTLTGWAGLRWSATTGSPPIRLPPACALTQALGVLGNNGITAYIGMLDRPAAAGRDGRRRRRLVPLGRWPGSWPGCGHLGSSASPGGRTSAPGSSTARLRRLRRPPAEDFVDQLPPPPRSRGRVLRQRGRAGPRRRPSSASPATAGRALWRHRGLANADHKPPGPSNYLELITQRGTTMTGFNTFDHWGPLLALVTEGARRLARRRLAPLPQHVVEGLPHAPRPQHALHRDNVGSCWFGSPTSIATLSADAADPAALAPGGSRTLGSRCVPGNTTLVPRTQENQRRRWRGRRCRQGRRRSNCRRGGAPGDPVGFCRPPSTALPGRRSASSARPKPHSPPVALGQADEGSPVGARASSAATSASAVRIPRRGRRPAGGPQARISEGGEVVAAGVRPPPRP